MPTANLNQLAHTVRLASMRLTRRVRYHADTMPPHHFAALAWLETGTVHTAAEMAEKERVSAPSMSRTVSELLEKGLISKETDPEDRRRQLLSLTQLGHEALANSRQQRNYWMSQQLARLTETQRKTLADAAEILNQLLEAK